MPLTSQGVSTADITQILEDTDELILEQAHVTRIFPEASDVTVTFTAHAVADTWSSWTRIQDSGGEYLDAQTLSIMHLSSILVEWASDLDKVYMIEIAYGDSTTVISRLRFISGERNFLPPLQQMRIRALGIPENQQLFYRMMCEVGGATCLVSFRYHYHN